MTTRSQSSTPLWPQLTSETPGSRNLMALAHWRAVVTYSGAVFWPICQLPYISLPSPQ